VPIFLYRQAEKKLTDERPGWGLVFFVPMGKEAKGRAQKRGEKGAGFFQRNRQQAFTHLTQRRIAKGGTELEERFFSSK